MATKPGGYFVGKDRVPSVTTVLSKFKDPGALMWWAWNEGINGRNFRETSGKAADAGTAAHRMAELHIHGQPYQPALEGLPTDVAASAENAFLAYLEWERQTQLKPVATELALVSTRYRFGGTLDSLMVQERLCFVDFKTSNAVYGEHLQQLAAYKLLWEENYPDSPIVGCYILRFAKEKGDFAAHWFQDLADEIRGFLLKRELYDLQAATDKRVK